VIDAGRIRRASRTVTEPLMDRGDHPQGALPILRGLPDADQDAGGERDAQPSGVLDVAQPVGEALAAAVGVGTQLVGAGLEHQAHADVERLQRCQTLVGEQTDVAVGQQSPPQGAAADLCDPLDEVRLPAQTEVG